jgi:dipeptidyl aminopeptidase/acylaminoacyl peptidase
VTDSSRQRVILWICAFLYMSTASAMKAPTIDDAFALKSVGAVSASPDGGWIALETGKNIVVLSVGAVVVEKKTLTGSFPRWSPDSRLLAFYSENDGKRQIYIWHPRSDTVEEITDLPEGISPNPVYFMGDRRSFAWSPDSRQVAFCSRRMTGYEALGQPDSPRVRVFVGNADPWYSQVMEGVFRTDEDENHPSMSEYDPTRTRAIERHPEMGMNKLLIVDVTTKALRQLTLSTDENFFASWSPDGKYLATVVSLDRAVEWPGPLQTALAIFNVRTGKERIVNTPMRLNGPPHWSNDGRQIALVGQPRLIGFSRIQIYTLRGDRWLFVRTPKDMAVISDGIAFAEKRGRHVERSLLVETPDRFVNTLWRIDLATGDAKQIDTHNLMVSEFTQDSTGNVYFRAESSTFVGRVFKRPVEASSTMQLLYEPNPQLSDLRFGEQRRITWTNKAGELVDGILILPLDYVSGVRYPVIVDVYPFPARDRFNLRSSSQSMGQIQAAGGYVVFIPGLRSPYTPGTYSRDESYNEKARGAKGIPILLDDFASGIDHLVKEGIADPNRIGIFGLSNGGYVVNLLITETGLMNCAVVSAGETTLIWDQYTMPPAGWVDEITNGNIYDDFKEFVEMSPLFRMNRVHAPLLMMVGDKDFAWVPHMLMEFNALRQLKKDVTFVRYADEGHVFSRPDNVRDSLARINGFFAKHLLGGERR